MRMRVVALSCAITIGCLQPVFAGQESDQASDNVALAALSCAAAPIVVGAAGYMALRAGEKRIVKLVDASGKAIGELTDDIFNDVKADCSDATGPRAQVENKEIPLVINKDYVEMNEKVTP